MHSNSLKKYLFLFFSALCLSEPVLADLGTPYSTTSYIIKDRSGSELNSKSTNRVKSYYQLSMSEFQNKKRAERFNREKYKHEQRVEKYNREKYKHEKRVERYNRENYKHNQRVEKYNRDKYKHDQRLRFENNLNLFL